jgi:polyisoprenoid-binding protein YceI
MRKCILVLLILGIWTLQAPAQTIWQIAPGRSSVKFKIKHLFLFHVEGKFRKFEGKVVTPDEGFANAQIEATIQAKSIYTGIRDRDRDLLGEDFFYVSEFQKILFKSKSTVKTGENNYKIIGDLTIRGITKPIELMAEFIGQKELSSGESRVDFNATGSLNRLDYGLRWNVLMETGKAIVGETVEIMLSIALLKRNE